MTFDLMRLGWPNTAAILALAIVPIVALAGGTEQRPAATAVEQTEPAAICLTAAECAVIALAAASESVRE